MSLTTCGTHAGGERSNGASDDESSGGAGEMGRDHELSDPRQGRRMTAVKCRGSLITSTRVAVEGVDQDNISKGRVVMTSITRATVERSGW